MITVKASSNFSFRSLERNLDKVFEGFMSADFNEDIAKSARNVIKNSIGLKPLTKGTIAIGEKGLSRKRPMPRSSNKPLIHTGSLLSTIKATDEGVEMAGYGKYHLNDYKIVSNSWTRKFTPKAIGKTVKARNPFQTPSENLRPTLKKNFNKMQGKLIGRINRALKGRI